MSHLKRGLLTLGSASIFARLIDLVAIIIVLLYLDAAELGAATTAVAAATLFEPLVGLGLGFTLIQRAAHPEDFESRAAGIALLSSLFLIAIALIPTLTLTGGSGFLVASFKLPWVALTLIPLHRLLRTLDYTRYAAAQTAATLVGAVSRIGLSAASAGALTLPLAYALHGLGLYLALLLLGVPIPRPRLPAGTSLRDLGYGIRAASGEFFERAFQQLDVLLIALSFGHAAVGIYRVAADLFFTVAQALMDLFQRASLPVLARASSDVPHFKRSLFETVRGLNFVLLPLIALIYFGAPHLIAKIQGGEFLEARLFFPALASRRSFGPTSDSFRSHTSHAERLRSHFHIRALGSRPSLSRLLAPSAFSAHVGMAFDQRGMVCVFSSFSLLRLFSISAFLSRTSHGAERQEQLSPKLR